MHQRINNDKKKKIIIIKNRILTLGIKFIFYETIILNIYLNKVEIIIIMNTSRIRLTL